MAKDEKKPRKKLTKRNTSTTNQPTKKMQPNTVDNIAKSKKLVEKIQKRKFSVNSSRSFSRSSVCSNGKPMPPLSELERMYEDCDEDDQSKTVPTQTNKLSTNSFQNVSTESITTIKQVAKKKMNIILNHEDPTSIIINNKAPRSPPKKRKKMECKDFPQVSNKSSTNFANGDDFDSEDEDGCPTKRAKKSDNISAWLQNCEKGDNSDVSNDSNKTVDYDYTKTPPVSNIGRPQTFSPLPSTSKDRETIYKNDQLFNESIFSETGKSNQSVDQSNVNILNEAGLASEIEIEPGGVKEEVEKLEPPCINITNTSNMDDIEIIQTPYETIVIDDDIETNRPIKRKYSDKSDIIECIDVVEPITKKENPKVTGYSEAIVIDDEDGYKFINESPTHDESCEVVDIDNIIAENKAIIEKFSKKSDKDINTVTCVDTSSISNLNTANSVEASNSSGTHQRNNNIVSKSNLNNNRTNTNQTNNIREIVTNYFTNNSDTDYQPQEQVRRNTAETGLLNKITEWLHNLTPNNATNKRRTARNRTQNVEPSNDSVIIIDDVSSPALNILNRQPDAATPTCTPPCSNSSSERVIRINGVEQSLTNTLQNPKVTLGFEQDFEYMNVYCSGDDMFFTGSDEPPPGLDNSNLVHKRIPIRDLFKKHSQIGLAVQSPVKSKSPRSSKNFGDCPICMDSLANNSVASTICGHVFCMTCIEAAFKASGKRCPTCRKVLKKGGYHQLFL